MAGIRRFQDRCARHGGERVTRIVVAVDRVFQRIEHFGAVGNGAAVDAGAVAINVGADGAAVETQHRLVRQDESDRIVVGRTAA